MSQRFHFPLKAVVLNFVVASAFLVIATFTPWIGLYLNSVTIWTILWVVTSIVAILLPLRKKGMVAGLPGGSWKVPLISIIGFVTLILFSVAFYWSVTTPAIGPSTAQADAILAIIFITGLLVYCGSYYYRRARGINLNAIYSEIPPE